MQIKIWQKANQMDIFNPQCLPVLIHTGSSRFYLHYPGFTKINYLSVFTFIQLSPPLLHFTLQGNFFNINFIIGTNNNIIGNYYSQICKTPYIFHNTL